MEFFMINSLKGEEKSMSEVTAQSSETKEIDDVSGPIQSEKTFRHYLFYWAGQQASLLGSSMVSFAIIWWVTITTQSELILGLASFVSLGPSILAMPFGGVIADRYNRKIILIIVDSFQAVATLALILLFMTNNVTITFVFIILGLRGIAQAFHAPVSIAVTPTMVPKEKLSRMNGLNYLFSGVINIIGPVVGAALLAIPGITIGLLMWADIITFGIAIIPLALITIPSFKMSAEEQKEPLFRQVTEGLHIMRQTKGFLPMMLTAMLFNFFTTPIMSLLPLFVNKTHLGTEANYALVIGMLQTGLVLGGLIMTFIKRIKKPIVFMMSTLIYLFVCQIVLIFVPTNFNGRFWTIGSILFLFALPISVIDVVFMTSIQLIFPKEKMGRVLAVVMTISPAIRPLGYFLSGLIAEYIGIKLIFLFASIIGIITVICMWIFTSLREMGAEIDRVLSTEEQEKTDETKKIETIKQESAEHSPGEPVVKKELPIHAEQKALE
jgi:DHA3 family macrolide efflux protein-like MFS transporter